MTTSTSTSIEQTNQQIIDEFSSVGDWQDRYRKLIGIGRELEPIAEPLKTDDNLVKGLPEPGVAHRLAER